MLSMTQINLIRTLYYGQGKTISEISRETGFDRKTIRKSINKESFNEDPLEISLGRHPGRPSSLTPFKAKIDSWLLEDLQYKRKQRHTAKRVYDRLCEEYAETFNCCYKTVANYVSSKRKDISMPNECYVKLVHIAGEAQVDFGAADFYERGRLYSGKYLNVSFPYSNQGYFQLFKGENQECLFEGLSTIFQYIGGVPTRLWFDNASTIVIDVMKDGQRDLTDDFLRFKNHYMFEAVFCNRGKGNEKGNVESKVGYHRRNILVPVPEFNDLKEYNKKLLDICRDDGKRDHYEKDAPIIDLHESDRKKLLKLPGQAFSSDKYIRVKLNTYGRFTLNKGMHEYSGVPRLAGEYATIRLTALTVHVLDKDFKELVVHERLYGETRQSSIKWQPFLTQLAMKPNAMKYSGIMESLPDPLKKYMEMCDNSEKSKVLTAISKISEESGFENALEAVSEAVRLEAHDPDSLRMIHSYQSMADMQLKDAFVPYGLPEMAKVKPELDLFDKYLKQGGTAVC